MKRLPLGIVLLSLLAAGPGAAAALPRETEPAQASPRDQLIVRGVVVEIHAPRVFTVRESARGGRELLVLSPRPLSPTLAGAKIVVHGVLRRLDAAELKRNAAWAAADERTRARFAGQTVMIARSILATIPLEKAPAEAETPEEPALPEAAPGEQALPGELALPPREPGPLPMRATTMASYINWIAGRRVLILDARVVGVLEPAAFLVEPATPYLKPMGERDRVLVLVESGTLTVGADLVVGEIVRIEGVARTLLGVRAAAEVPWPARLTPEAIERLEIRAALLATSVQTPEGVSLTGGSR